MSIIGFYKRLKINHVFNQVPQYQSVCDFKSVRSKCEYKPVIFSKLQQKSPIFSGRLCFCPLIEMFVWSQQSKSKGLKPQNLVQPYFLPLKIFYRTLMIPILSVVDVCGNFGRFIFSFFINWLLSYAR